MTNKKEYNHEIIELAQLLRNKLYYEEIPGTVTRLVFLKYALDNLIGCAENRDDYLLYNKASQVFHGFSDDKEVLNAIDSILVRLDDQYHLNKTLCSRKVMDSYADDLFGAGNGAKRRTFDPKSNKEILNYVGSLYFEDDAQHGVGCSLSEAIKNLYYRLGQRHIRTGAATTNSELAYLVKAVLNVQDKETFCDFTSGMGFSSLLITKDIDCRAVLQELDDETASQSAMLFILEGRQNFSVFCGDFSRAYITGLGIIADKIFIDPPIDDRRNTDELVKQDSRSIAVRAIEYAIKDVAKDCGLVVSTCKSNILFGTSGGAGDLRKQLVDQGWVRAVIALPSMWRGAGINTNLLILSREQTENVVFINIVSKANKPLAIGPEISRVLGEDNIKRIANMINNPGEEEGFSAVVNVAKIKESGYNLTPANYVMEPEVVFTETLEELDQKLDDLYEQLHTLQKQK